MIIVEKWIQESREVRTAHLDLSEECLERGGNSTTHRGVLAQFLTTNFPSKIDLCHACGNEKCSNPKHLYWGTRSENVQDAIVHGTLNGNPFLILIERHGEDRARQIMSERGSKFGKLGGQNNKGKPKSEAHRLKISESLKKRGRGEIGETHQT